ncbi:hypothetical protein LTR85_000858 [Meristemomyces frigidus]|nr:hypothetical protein LTR85_000858 [Meristemomyces frigidus]
MPTEFGAKAARQKQVYRELGQGIKTFHEDRFADVDILAVPGLGTNPTESWTWTAGGKNGTKQSSSVNAAAITDATDAAGTASKMREQFNWIRDPDGLASLFPRSRIMLYDYASAWGGALKVRATMKSICTVLLDDLREKRKGGAESTRPLILIGHSMGGVVIAKTLCMAKARKEYEAIATCTMGCAFFGVPFRGTEMAKIALLYSSMFGNEAYEALLTFMRTEKNDTLDEVREDFVEFCGKLNPPVDLFCAYEEVPSDVSFSSRLIPKGLLQHKYFATPVRAVTGAGLRAFGAGTHFVSKESAILEGAHIIGLTADHRALIRFESVTSEKFVPVKRALTKMVQTARMNARKRNFSSGQNLLTHRFVNQVRQALEGVDMRLNFRASVAGRPVTSWLTSEPSYQDWLTDRSGVESKYSYLWLKGGPGFGKTNAALAAIQSVSQAHIHDQQSGEARSQDEAFLAYFLCERSPGCCTAEDVLKSFIIQLINQEESLAQHAKWLVSNSRYRHAAADSNALLDGNTGISGAQATATVENLWKYLLDMIDDPAVDRIHLVISNLHCLESNESTVALLSRLGENAVSARSLEPGSRRAKWLITSRNEKQIRNHLEAEHIAIIDLENDREYGGKLKLARQNHARDAVSQLRARKSYSSDLAYYIRNSIGGRSEDERWIDVLCLLLEEKPSDSSNLSIRKWLREVGHYNIHELIEHAWESTLSRNEDARLEIEELLQVMTIAYEPPTLAELAALTQNNDQRRMADLVRRCSPIFRFGTTGDQQEKVLFTNAQFKERLSIVAHGHEDHQKRQYHGLMALRCFTYIKSFYGSDSPTMGPDTLPNLGSVVTARVVDDPNVIVVTDRDDELDEADTASSQALSLSCSYPIKYLIKHLGEGFPDVAQELCDDDPDFWGQDSSLRDAWLGDFRRTTNDLKNLNTVGMSALHVAAGIGATELGDMYPPSLRPVSILVARNGMSALSWTNEEGMTALHVAALNNHYDVIDVLIKVGADIEAGEGRRAGTALHLAALHGYCNTMSLLIGNGANVNALREGVGPVINAAILSGTVDAVKSVVIRIPFSETVKMHGDVRFDLDYTTCDPPLSLSAGRSEPSLFQDILETGKAKWLQNVKLLDQALIAASAGGRLESVRILLRFQHVYTDNTLQTAIFSAAVENKWSPVKELLDYVAENIAHEARRAISLDDVFYLAAVSREDRLDVLERIWHLKSDSIPHDILDFSVYQATVLKKISTVIWLLDICHASANAASELPSFLSSDHANVVSSPDFQNALNAAAGIGHLGLVESLLSRGARVNDAYPVALQLAAAEGFVDIVNTVLRSGAMIDATIGNNVELNLSGGTALQAACDNGRLAVVETLIKHGANPNLGYGHKSPITSATLRSGPDILKVLLDAPGIDINVIDGETQSTPLIYAATNMPADAVTLLVQKGADVNARNASGDTALIMAAWKGDKACVEMLCNAGGDVTYRSRRGLAIQVAANELHAECAHVIAERMGRTIGDYEEQVPQKLAIIQERDNDIETLNSLLAETNEQLEIAKKDFESQQFEIQRLRSISSLQGETYESIGQQLRAMQNERVELLKQLDASKGQAGLANDTVSRLRTLLDEEKETNASLRKRQGYVALQEEKKAALELLEQERKSASDQSQLYQQERGEHIQEIQFLLTRDKQLEATAESAQRETETALKDTEIERRAREEGEEKVRSLQEEVQRLESVLASVQEAASKNKPRLESRTLTEDSGFQDGESPLRTKAFRSQSDTLFVGAASDAAGSVLDSTTPVAQFRGAADALKRRQTDGPASSTSSPTSPSVGGFRTIHGQHRVDGSLGGYRTDRQKRLVKSDSLYSVSVKSVSERSPSEESMA